MENLIHTAVYFGVMLCGLIYNRKWGCLDAAVFTEILILGPGNTRLCIDLGVSRAMQKSPVASFIENYINFLYHILGPDKQELVGCPVAAVHTEIHILGPDTQGSV